MTTLTTLPKPVRSMFRITWCAETSADPEGWTEENPAWGQCAVSALVIQDALGGDLLRSLVYRDSEVLTSHYYNRLPNGAVVDVTREQFLPGDVVAEESTETRDRAYVLDNPDTNARYELLKERLARL